MGAMTTVQVQVGVDVQKRAAEVLQREGLTIEQAVERMLERTAEEGTLPLWAKGSMVSTYGEEDPVYDKWFRAQVQEALDDPRPMISSEEVDRRAAVRRQKLIARAVVKAPESCL